MPFEFRIILCTVHKAVGYVMWLDVSLKKEGTMIIIILGCNIFGC